MAPSTARRCLATWAFIFGLMHPRGTLGAFLPTAEVLMADGTTQQLENIRVGDQVLSWDETVHKPVMSTVQAISRQQRAPEELFELRLPIASVAVTKDHPLWSHSRQHVVSLSPNATLQVYSLRSELLLDGDFLEGPDGGPVTASLGAVAERSLSQAANAGSREATDAITLCLYPYHWFFVHGIRVHNKGCFEGSVEVTMADGSSKPLQDIRVGDMVSSWNEADGKGDVSTVRAVPTFQRDEEDLVELLLPSASFLVTEDHPFWSSSQKSLVSAHPNKTSEFYSLQATLMQPGQILEGLRQEDVPVLSVRRSPLSRRVQEGTTVKRRPNGTSVMTLCLHPHHWYYVHGVRVHNKGCFEASAQVTMADGSPRALGEIRVGDMVSSFDETTGTTAVSTVRAVPEFQRSAEEMVEIQLPRGTLQATEDHPFWSRSHNGLVSSAPSKTQELYNLSAKLMEHGHHLEGLQQEVIPVLSVRRSLQSRRLGEACIGSNCTNSVMTLCLEPHHWFYVNGVRVHNKGSSGGCFVGNVEVTMADRSIKRLDQVQVGDAVASWDEVARRSAIATVKAVPEFERKIEELVEIELPKATFRSTEDHPFWSSSQQCLVSVHPNKTTELYDLKAELLQAGEKLEGLEQEDIPVKSIRRQKLSRRMDTQTEGNATERVLTLALEPHHWFYIHGVRVHNKGSSSGCFAPWTPILVPGGSSRFEKPISEIQIQDKVISWDEELGQLSEATVVGIDIVESSQQMFEILLNGSNSLGTSQSAALESSRLLEAEPQSLVLTADHPVYSSRTGGLVSMSPSLSSSRYGLDVSQMEQFESLHHHLGHQLYGHVRPWPGKLPKVITLRLDRHHWFFAQGVRVHNKGSSGGTSRTVSVYTTRSSFPTYNYYGYYLVGISSRRRYGTYTSSDPDPCDMVSSSQAVSLCQSTISPNASDINGSWLTGGTNDSLTEDQATCSLTAQCCANCLSCNDTACVDGIYNCNLYLSQIYTGCRDTKTEDDNTTAIVVGSVFGSILVLLVAFCCWWREIPCRYSESCNSCWEGCGRSLKCRRRSLSEQLYDAKRSERLSAALRGGSFPLWAELRFPLQLSGSYTELGTSTFCQYTINQMDMTGAFKGLGTDDDGTAGVDGVVLLNLVSDGQYQGEIHWEETRYGAAMEVYGLMTVVTATKTVYISASYISTYQSTQGSLQIQGSYSNFLGQNPQPWADSPPGAVAVDGEPSQQYAGAGRAVVVTGQPVGIPIGASQQEDNIVDNNVIPKE